MTHPSDSNFTMPGRRSGAVGEILRRESVGGLLLVVAAVAAVIVANTPWVGAYESLRDWRIGPETLGLHLTIGEWAADGLLTLFFFLAGLELKRECAVGQLRTVRRALVPVVAAIGGIAAPAVIYALINLSGSGAEVGWAIPTATDIAFALAVFGLVGRALPPVLRVFLLTLAVVDDLLAITIIAVFYTSGFRVVPLLGALVAIGGFAALVRARHVPVVLRWAGAITMVAIAWALMHRSGVHSTVAGVLMGLTIPVTERGRRREETVLAARLDHALRPISAGVVVPVFAFFAAGVTVGGWSGLAHSLGERVTLGVAVALVAGKAIGIFTTTVVASAMVRSPILQHVSRVDIAGLSLLGGIGFTVSLLIGQLAFADAPTHLVDARVGVLTGSIVSALLGTVVLSLRHRHRRAPTPR